MALINKQREFSEQELENIKTTSPIMSEQASMLAKVEGSELVTRRDLTELKLKLIKWMLGIGITAVVSLVGMLSKEFHWW